MNEKVTKQNEVERLLGSAIAVKIGGKVVRIKEPTLGVMDLMTREWLKLDDIEIGENTSNLEALQMAKRAVSKHAKSIAKAVAVGIIGEGCFKPFGGLRVWLKARKVYRLMTGKECRQVAEQLTGAGGLMDFIVAMKLMSAAETTRKSDIAE